MDDIEQIRRMLYEYCYGTDSGDVEAWLATFTDDVIWEGGPFGSFRGKDGGRAYVAGNDTSVYRHLTLNSIIDVDGDEGTGKAYILLLHVTEEGSNVAFSGVYEDRYVKKGGRWLIAERHLHPQIKDLGKIKAMAVA